MIYSIGSIEQEPKTFLSYWKIYKIGDDFHFNGIEGRFGDSRFSSKIVEFDPATLTGKTRSGRLYQLVGETGNDREAEHIANAWMQMNSVDTKTVSTVAPQEVII